MLVYKQTFNTFSDMKTPSSYGIALIVGLLGLVGLASSCSEYHEPVVEQPVLEEVDMKEKDWDRPVFDLGTPETLDICTKVPYRKPLCSGDTVDAMRSNCSSTTFVLQGEQVHLRDYLDMDDEDRLFIKRGNVTTSNDSPGGEVPMDNTEAAGQQPLTPIETFVESFDKGTFPGFVLYGFLPLLLTLCMLGLAVALLMWIWSLIQRAITAIREAIRDRNRAPVATTTPAPAPAAAPATPPAAGGAARGSSPAVMVIGTPREEPAIFHYSRKEKEDSLDILVTRRPDAFVITYKKGGAEAEVLSVGPPEPPPNGGATTGA